MSIFVCVCVCLRRDEDEEDGMRGFGAEDEGKDQVDFILAFLMMKELEDISRDETKL